MRYFFPLIILLLLVFFLWKGLDEDLLPIPSPLINKPMPAFALASVEGSNNLFTEKIFWNHLSLLVVWSSWCGSCVTENAFLLSIKNNSGLQIIGLNYKDSLLSAKHWLNQYGNPYHEIIFDPKGLLSINLGVYGVPESFLLDEKGIIRYKHIGPLNASIWNTEIKPFLVR